MTAEVAYRDLLTRPRVGRFFYGQAVSGFGDSLMPVALSFAVLRLTGSLTLLAVALALARMPSLVIQLLGGVAGDRDEPRRLARTTSWVAGGLNMVTAVGLWLPLSASGAVAVVIATQVLAGMTGSFGGPASGKLVRVYFPDPADVKAAAALTRTLKSVMQVGAQAMSGVFVLLGSPASCFVINSATFFFFVCCLPRQPADSAKRRQVSARSPVLRDLTAGWRAMRRDRAFFGSVMANALCWLLIIQPYLTMAPVILEGVRGGHSSVAWGLVGACFGVGGIIAGMLARRLNPARPLTAAVVLSLCDVPLMIQLALAPGSPALYLWSLLSGLQSVASRIWLSQQLYTRFPGDVTARVVSWLSIGWMLPSVLGAALTPLVVSAVGTAGALWSLLAVFVAGISLMALTVRSAENKGLAHVA